MSVLAAPTLTGGTIGGTIAGKSATSDFGGFGPVTRGSGVSVFAQPYEAARLDGPAAPKYRISLAGATSANKDVKVSRRQAVINARDVDRNNPLISSGITKRAVNTVGANLKLQALPAFSALGLDADWAEEFATQWEQEFSLWAEDPRANCDATRHNQFGGLMLQQARNVFGADGEAVGIIRFDLARKKKYRARMGTFLEIIDPDRVSNPMGALESDTLSQGRVLDEYGAMTGFWVEDRHPSEVNKVRTWNLVPRETSYGRPVGYHWFPKHRAGLQRGLPAIISSMRDVRMLDTFDEKTLRQAILAAFMSIYIKTDATTAEAITKLSGTPTGSKGWKDLMSARFDAYEGSMGLDGQAMPVMAPGDEIGVAQSSHAANNQDSFRYAFERKFASILNLSYANFSNDYAKTSFASIRGEFIDMWRLTFADRYLMTQGTASQVALAHLEECIAYGKLKLPPGAPPFYDNWEAYAQHEWRGPAMGWVDPVKDVTGAGMRIAAGLSNPQKEAAEQGGDFYDNIDSQARAVQYAKRKGITLVWGPQSQQTRIDEQLGPDGEPIDPNNPQNEDQAQASEEAGAGKAKETTDA